MPSSTRRASLGPWSTPPIPRQHAPCSPAILEAQPDARRTSCATTDLVRDVLVAIACASRSLVGRARRTTRRWSSRCATETRSRRAQSVDGYRRVDSPPRPSTIRTALRTWKRREYFRIAARDLLGVADLPAVGRELAALAEVCLQAGAGPGRARPEARSP